MGRFRDLMERDLQIRGLSRSTQGSYLGRMKEFVRYYMRPPDQLTLEDIHNYQLYLTRERKVSWGVFNQSVAALRFFYGVTLDTDWDVKRIPYQRTGRKLPIVLSQSEVKALLDTVTTIKHRAILMTTYAAGLRVSEVVNLQVADIDSQRMMLRIEQGKGRKDRYVMLSHKLLTIGFAWLCGAQHSRGRPNLWFLDLAAREALQFTGRGSGDLILVEGTEVTAVALYEGLDFAEAEFIPIAFSVWDGFNGERGNKRGLTQWRYLYLEPRQRESSAGPMVKAGLGVLGLELLLLGWLRRRQRKQPLIRGPRQG